MKKFLTLLLTITVLLSLSSINIFAETQEEAPVTSIEDTAPPIDGQETATETPTTEAPATVINEPAPEVTTEDTDTKNTAVPAVEQLINILFDGNVTISQSIEYITIVAAALFSFGYNKYKRKLISKEKAISKTDIEIEELKKSNEDLSNQLGLLGNLIVCAYLSNNLVDPELKKKLAAYAEELMDGTTIDKDKLTEKLILTAQKPDFQQKVTDLKDAIIEEANQKQDVIDNVKEDITILTDTLNAETITKNTQAEDVIDNLKIED